jgi:hypothetical protein
MTPEEAAAFRAGFRAGFSVSREGFNGECAFDHLAPSEEYHGRGASPGSVPDPPSADDPLCELENIALRAWDKSPKR